ncbi:NAD-dependent protein deacylase [Aphelenchoides besseyi]|nr:NAD-dependent protein deacylase [Aphelenchoides besseyi]
MMSGLMRFVPQAEPVSEVAIHNIQKLIDNSNRFAVLTGAGLSTESGIPDYRSERVGQFARTPHRPIQHHEFMSSEYFRRRYWARNYVAHPRFNSAPCNISHLTLAEWEKKTAKFQWMITQNVDALHLKAGSTRLTELHGSATRVVCMGCKRKYPRIEIQTMIKELNPDWRIEDVGEMKPDGDIDIPDSALTNFRIPYCQLCGERSILKTDVVFFGDNVPRQAVDECYEHMEQSDLLLVFGSSLTVLSGFRFVHFASMRRIPIVIVNIGKTRADDLGTLKVNAKCSEVITALRV